MKRQRTAARMFRTQRRCATLRQKERELLMSLAVHQQLDENGQAVKQMAMNCIAEICSTFSEEELHEQ
jgi:hypothetical protein